MKQSDLVDKCLENMALSKKGPADSARELLTAKWSTLDRETKFELAVCGLAHNVADKSARLRLIAPKPTGSLTKQANRVTRRMTAAVGKAVSDHATAVLRSISLYARGGMRTLFDFTADDLNVWGQKAGAKSQAWINRAHWCDEAKAALETSKVKTLGELPIKARNEIAASAERTWTSVKRKRAVRRAA